MVPASPCACIGLLLEFEANVCFRCGRSISVVPEMGGMINGTVVLDMVLDRMAADLPARAAAEGVDVSDPVEYAAWLEAGLLPTASALDAARERK